VLRRSCEEKPDLAHVAKDNKKKLAHQALCRAA